MQNLEFERIAEATQKLRDGEICIVQTDCGYEALADATSAKAVEKLLSIFNGSLASYAILVANIDYLSRYLREFPEIAEELFVAAASPLNLILPTVSGINPALVIETDKAPFRIPTEDFFIAKLLKKINRPLVAIPVSGSYDKPFTNKEHASSSLLANTLLIDITLNANTKAPSVIQLGLGGEIKIIRN